DVGAAWTVRRRIPTGAGLPLAPGHASPRQRARRPAPPRRARARAAAAGRPAPARRRGRARPGPADRGGRVRSWRGPSGGGEGVAAGQRRAQLVHGVAQARLHGLAADAGDGPDLLQAQLLLQAQQHHLALLAGQGIQRLLQAAVPLQGVHAPLGRLRVLHAQAPLLGVGGRRGAVLARAPVVGHAVAGDAVQPGRERRVGTPVRPRRHHPLPGVLEDLVGQPGVAQLAQQETVEALAVATVEPFERGHVAAGPGPHQRVVAGLVGGSGRQVLHAREGKPWPRGREARARRRAAVHHWGRGHRGEAPCELAARGRFPRFHRGTHSGTGGGTARVQAMLDIPVNTAPREIDLAGLAGMLAQSLPTGSGVVVCWDDERLGAGRSEVDGVGESLRARAHALAAGERMSTDGSGALIDESWTEGEARVAIAARLPEPLSPGSREAWRALARRLVSATIAAAQAEARIESLRKSERLQQALYEIADLAGSGLEMEEMLKRIHGVVGGLMSAANFYIVLYDDVRATLRFLYFADQLR